MTNTCTKVFLRRRPYVGGKVSLYLDYYPAIRNPHTNKMTRRETLGIVIYAEPANEMQRRFNQEMEEKAEAIRCIRYQSLINEQFGFLDKAKQKMDFLAYFEKKAKSKYDKWMSVYLHFKKFNGSPVLKQSHSNLKDFENIISLTSPEDLKETDKSSQINKASTYFRLRLRDIFINKENKNANGKRIIDYDTIFMSLNFVVIKLDESDDEQQIFDTINSLGVKLTTGELLKNYLFSAGQVDDYNGIWKPVFEKDNETISFWNSQMANGRNLKKTIDIFLFYFLQIKAQDPALKIDKRQARRMDNLFVNLKEIVEANHLYKDIFALEISKYANLFMKCFRRDEENGEFDVPSSFGLERISFIINNLDSNTMIPYVLYIMNSVSSQEERNIIFGFLETYVIRRLIVDSNNNNYSDLFSENLIGQRIDS